MAQEKQNSVKILQTKPKKATNRSRRAILFGMVAVIVLACFSIATFLFTRPLVDQTITNTQNINELPIQPTQSQESSEDVTDFQNQANDKELSGLFKHQKTNTTVKPDVEKPTSSSPFDFMLGHEKKTAPVHLENKTNKPPLSPQKANTVPEPVSRPTPAVKAKAEKNEPTQNASSLNKLDIQKELDNPLLNNKNVAQAKAKEE